MQVNNKKYHETGKQSGENKRFLGFAGCDIIKTEKTTGGVTSMKKLYFSLIYLAASVMLLIGLAHDAFLYKETVVRSGRQRPWCRKKKTERCMNRR